MMSALRVSSLLCGVVVPGVCVAQPFNFENVALTGRSDVLGPGLGAGVVFDTLRLPIIDSTGRVATASTLAGTGVTSTNNSVIWTGVPGAITRIARESDAAPGTPVGVFTDLSIVAFGLQSGSNGRVAFSASTSGGVPVTGVWRGGASSLQLVYQAGAHAPGVPLGANFSQFVSDMAMSATGDVSVIWRLSGLPVSSTNDTGLWIAASDGPVSLIMREGDQAPTFPAGRLVGELPTQTGFSQSASGDMSWATSVTGDVAGTSTVIWARRGGTVGVVANSANAPVGVESGVTFESVRASTFIADGGVVAFSGQLQNVPGPNASTRDEAIWIQTGAGATSLALREGDAAPGTAPGVLFTNSELIGGWRPQVNADGQMVTRTGLVGSGVTLANSSGLWAGVPGALSKVVRAGDSVPGLPAAAIFSVFTSALPVYVLNGSNQVAFHAALQGAGSANQGLWVWDAVNGTRPVLIRNLTTIPCADGVTRTVSGFTFTEKRDRESPSPASGFADDGWLAFSATFTDGVEGVFRVRIAPPVVGGCDSIDFNGDGLFPDVSDIDDFVSVFAGGACSTGTCGDIDFNNDGLFPDTGDIDAFLRVFAGGSCF
jgi:hypothetical protein